MTFWRFVDVFWWLLIFDVPRYILPDLLMFGYLGIRSLLGWPRPVQMDRSYEPSVSVLVPAYNEGPRAAKTVRSLLEQDYPIERIIVVDDGSQDDTFERLQVFAKNPKVAVIHNEVRGGKASALQTALRYAKGEIIVSCDSDSTFDRDAVRWLVQYFKDPRVGAVAGNVRVRNRTRSLLTWMQAAEYEIVISVGRRVLGWFGWMTVVSGAFGAYRRDALDKSGGWDPGIGDDSNATLKVRKLKRKVAFAAEAVCLTEVPDTLKVLWRQRRRWDKSGYRNRIRKHPQLLDPRQFGWSSPLAIVTALVYRVALLFLFLFWFFYDLLIRHQGDLAWVLILTFIIYGVSNLLSLLVAWWADPGADAWKMLWLAPLMMFFHWFLRLPRAISTVEEIFGLNYRQRFYPDTVWEQAPRW